MVVDSDGLCSHGIDASSFCDECMPNPGPLPVNDADD